MSRSVTVSSPISQLSEIASRVVPGHRGDDGAIPSHERVEERRLPRVRPSEDRDDFAPIAFASPRGRSREGFRFARDGEELLRGRAHVRGRHVLGEIQRGLEPREHVENSLPRRPDAPRQLSLYERKRPPRRSPALRPGERGQPFGLGQIQLAVRQGPPCEFPPRRRPRPGSPRGREKPRHDRGRSVAEKLHHLFARRRMRSRKEDDEGAVERTAILSHEAVERRLARAGSLREPWRDPSGGRERRPRGSRQPDDGERETLPEASRGRRRRRLRGPDRPRGAPWTELRPAGRQDAFGFIDVGPRSVKRFRSICCPIVRTFCMSQ